MLDFTNGNFRVTWLGAKVYDELHRSWIKVDRGHTVLKGTQGEFYPIQQQALRTTYTELQ